MSDREALACFICKREIRDDDGSTICVDCLARELGLDD